MLKNVLNPIARLLFRLGLVAVLCAPLLWLGRATWLAVRLQANLTALADLPDTTTDQIDFDQVKRQIHEARADASDLQEQLAPLSPVTAQLGGVPNIGSSLVASAPLLDYIVNLTTAADELLTGFEPLVKVEVSTQPLSQSVYNTLLAAQPQIATAHEALARATLASEQIELESLPIEIRSKVEKVNSLLPLAQQGVAFLNAAPNLLGRDAPRTYLLLAQNSDELRPTGGFISGAGVVKVFRGKVLEVSIADSYQYDDFSKPYPYPPDPLRYYMQADYWVLRDSNWSPDFPSAARTAQSLFELTTNQHVDGVVAFTPTLLQFVLRAVGPVQIPNLAEPVSANNLFDYMHSAWSTAPGQKISKEWWLHRKDFMRDLGQALIAQVQGNPDRRTLVALAKALPPIIAGKHLLVYAEQPTLAASLKALHIDGSVAPTDGDYLFVVDTNIGWGKVNPFVKMAVSYQIDLSQPQAPQATLQLSYTHTIKTQVVCEHKAKYGDGSYAAETERCYWDYWRVLTPANTQLLESSVHPIAGQFLLTKQDDAGRVVQLSGENQTTEFAALMLLPTGATQTNSLRYQLPATVVKAERDLLTYQLKIQKQPGQQTVRYALSLNPPTGYHAIHLPAEWKLTSQGALTTTVVLDQDRVVKLVFQKD